MCQIDVTQAQQVQTLIRSPRRWLLMSLGVLCVGLAALGVILPGLPTTVFLMAASYLFTKSCPWLEERLIRNRFFAPFLKYLDNPGVMPMRARVVSLAAMWIGVSCSTWLFVVRYRVPILVPVLSICAAFVGSWAILRAGRGAHNRVTGARRERRDSRMN